MIKGVNRQVVEVNDTECDYFEKIMFFVKPEYTSLSEGKIRERAGRIAAKAGAVPPTKIHRSALLDALRLLGAVLFGVALASAVFLSIR